MNTLLAVEQHSAGLNAANCQRAEWTRDVELVFLVGSPRSGTTWLQAMLSEHPTIYTGPETHFFAAFEGAELGYLRERGRPLALPAYWDTEKFYHWMAELFWDLISALPTPTDKPSLFLEKTPNHSANAGFILRTFPRARFIHLIRDARAVVASLVRSEQSWGTNWAPHSIDEAAGLWRRYVGAGRQIKTKVSSPAQYIELRYEDLRRNAVRELDRLFAWLGVCTSPDWLTRIAAKHTIEKTLAAAQPFESIPIVRANPRFHNVPAYPKGFVGRGDFDLDQVSLSSLQRRRIEQINGDLLRELGYPVERLGVWFWERAYMSFRLRRWLGRKPY